MADAQFHLPNDKEILYCGKMRQIPSTAVVLNGIVYDIEEFARSGKHPGGNVILACGTTDVTSLFYSMHRRAKLDKKRYEDILEQYKIATLAEEKPSSLVDYESNFAKELYDEVVKEFPLQNWYANNTFWIRTWLIIFVTILSEYFWATTADWKWMILVGVMHASIGLSIQHDASHGAISRKPWINAFFSHGADWIGNSRFLWFQQHIIGHHPNTNHLGKDGDIQSAEPLLLFHTYEETENKKQFWHKFQHIFLYPVLSLYGPSIVYNFPQLFTQSHGEIDVSRNAFIQSHILPAVLLRFWYYFRISFYPYYYSGGNLLLCLFGIPLVTGSILTFLFVLSHNFQGSDRFPYDDKNNKISCFSKAQVETSCTYGGWISMFLTGGLNFQIEHHLFPRMNSCHYPRIQHIVRRVCLKHNVHYEYYDTIIENMLSTIQFMKNNGGIVHYD